MGSGLERVCREARNKNIEEYKRRNKMKSDLEMYEGVYGCVEASSFETLRLWERWHHNNGYSWEESTGGPLITVGHIGTRPVCIAPLVHIVNGKKLLFIEATSMIVDWSMIMKWAYENVPSARIADTDCVRWTDPNNFHNFVH